jgi:hypothetical protein
MAVIRENELGAGDPEVAQGRCDHHIAGSCHPAHICSSCTVEYCIGTRWCGAHTILFVDLTHGSHARGVLISSPWRTDVKKEEIVQSAGHLRMLRFLKDCPDDAKLHSTIIYALSQVALLGTAPVSFRRAHAAELCMRTRM